MWKRAALLDFDGVQEPQMNEIMPNTRTEQKKTNSLRYIYRTDEQKRWTNFRCNREKKQPAKIHSAEQKTNHCRMLEIVSSSSKTMHQITIAILVVSLFFSLFAFQCVQEREWEAVSLGSVAMNPFRYIAASVAIAARPIYFLISWRRKRSHSLVCYEIFIQTSQMF